MKRLLSIISILLILSFMLTGCDILDEMVGILSDGATVTGSDIGTENGGSVADSELGGSTDDKDNGGSTLDSTQGSTLDSTQGSTIDSSSTGGSLPEDDSFGSLDDIPPYNGSVFVHLNNKQPEFTQDEITTDAYEFYSDLDSLGRCGYAMACIGKELMPSGDRGSISSVYPTGWVQAQYDCVDGTYLYNRCHLIGFQLTGENANRKNLITGTKYLNNEGMLPFENMVADYIKETSNHVMYRVTPVFAGDNLLANGVQIEAYSVEDEGDGICFNIFIYNAQPQIKIDYATGKSSLIGDNDSDINKEPETDSSDKENEDTNTEEKQYVLNTGTKKIHSPNCSSVEDIKEENRQDYYGSIEELIEMGYEPCGRCKP